MNSGVIIFARRATARVAITESGFVSKFVNYINRNHLLKSLPVIILIFLVTGFHTNAQNIFFCSDYNSKGEPIGATKTWNIDEKGRYVYVVFSNHNKVIKSKKLTLNIRKKSGTVYRNYEKRVMKIQSGRTWALLDYQFTEAGDYEVSVMDNQGKVLSTYNFPVNLKTTATEDKTSTENLPNKGPLKDPDRGYYKAETIFSKLIADGTRADTGSVFRAGELNVEIVNNGPLASDTMIVDVFKKGYETEKYPIYVTSKNFWIDGGQNKASFSLNLDQTGEYKVITYNRRSQTISEGFVTIR